MKRLKLVLINSIKYLKPLKILHPAVLRAFVIKIVQHIDNLMYGSFFRPIYRSFIGVQTLTIQFVFVCTRRLISFTTLHMNTRERFFIVNTLTRNCNIPALVELHLVLLGYTRIQYLQRSVTEKPNCCRTTGVRLVFELPGVRHGVLVPKLCHRTEEIAVPCFSL